jgi:HSP20 family protein
MTRLIPRMPSLPSRWGWLDEDFDKLFEDFWRPVPAFEASRGDLVPSVDVSEDDNQYLVRAELPGVKRDDINVTVENGVLTITAETKSEEEKKEGERYIRQERRYGKYMRSLRLGADIDERKVKANYKDGVLELVLPKTEAVKPKRVTVEVS